MVAQTKLANWCFQVVAVLAFWMAASGSLAAKDIADDPVDGEIVTVGAKYLFAPVGFDDNDVATVVIDGFLPSGCYRLVQPEVEVDHDSKQIIVTPKARFYDHPCIEVLVPFWQEIHLGILSVGDYKISVPASSIHEAMHVAEAPSAGPDDYLYAAIDAAEVDRPLDSDSFVIKMQGRFTNSCMVLSDIRVIDTGRTINVLPIMTMEDRNDCHAVEVPFRRMVNLPISVTEGRHLLHVRSLNGQAVNHVFTK